MQILPGTDYVYKRYKWAIDAGEVIDLLTGKPIAPKALQQRLLSEGHALSAPDKFPGFLDALKLLGANLIDIRREIKQARKVKAEESSIKQLIDEAYLALKPNFQLYNQPIEGTTQYHFRDSSGEVRTLGREKIDGFVAAIREFPPLLTAIRQVYEDPRFEQIKASQTMDAFVQDIFKRYTFDPDRLISGEPPAISWDSSVFALKQLDATMLQPLPIPAWDEFLARLDHPEVFKAWVWAVFDPENFGRQALYLYGAGFDGKSSVIKAISSVLGNRLTMSVDNSALKNTQFFFGNAHNRRLITYGECKVSNVLRYETVKALLGGDIVQVNKKNEKAFSTRIFARLIIGSNKYPKIDPNERSELSRLLFIKVAPISKNSLGDSTFEHRLKAEMGAFLYQCQIAYTKLCPTGMEISMPPEMLQTILTECVSIETEVLAEFIEDCLEFVEPGTDPNSYSVPKTELKKALKTYFADQYSVREADNALETLSVQLAARGVQQGRLRIGHKRVLSYIGMRLKIK